MAEADEPKKIVAKEADLSKMVPLVKKGKGAGRKKRSATVGAKDAKDAPPQTRRVRAMSGTMSIPIPKWKTQAEAFEGWAAQGMQSDPKVLEKLAIEWKIPLNQPNKRGETILQHAAYHGCRMTVTYLLKVKADPSLKDINGSTPLFAACSNQVIYLPIIDQLLRAGAPVDQIGPQEATALQLAASIGNLALVKTLCNHRPNLLALSKEGTASDIAKNRSHTAVYDYLKQLENSTPKQLVPQSAAGGRTRRRWSFAKRAADKGDPIVAGLQQLVASMADQSEKKEPPRTEKINAEDLEGMVDDGEIYVDPDGPPDFSNCVHVDPNDKTKLLKFLLEYDGKKGKLKLNGNVQDAFDQMDWKKTDKQISIDEFQAYFGQQGLSARRCKRLFVRFDKDHNDNISFKEFNQRMQELKVVGAYEAAPSAPAERKPQQSPKRRKPGLVKSSSLNNETKDIIGDKGW